MASLNRKQKTKVRHVRLRQRVIGTPARPRLAVHFSTKIFYAQVMEGVPGIPFASVNTTGGKFKTEKAVRANSETAVKVGKLLAERAKSKSIASVVFDRGG